MEGSNGKILCTEDPQTVIKRIRRNLKHRARSLTAQQQCAMQQWCASLLTPANGFLVLWAPRAWGAEEKQFSMQRIDCTEEIRPTDPRVLEDLRLFYEKARGAGIFPCDYELYLQPDGRIALVDVDKFATWTPKGSVLFPWGLVWDTPVYPWDQESQ